MIKNIITVIFVLFFGYICYDYGYKTAYNKEYKIKVEQLTEQQARYLELQKKSVLYQLEKENEIKSINSKHTAIINSLRNRPERTPKDESTSIVCAGAGSTGEQLFREDAEFLIGQAQLAEILKQSLTVCRRYLLETNK